MENSSYDSCGGGAMDGSPTLGRVFPTGQFYRVSLVHVTRTLGRQDTDLIMGLLARSPRPMDTRAGVQGCRGTHAHLWKLQGNTWGGHGGQ